MTGTFGPYFPQNPFYLEFAEKYIKSIQSGGYLWLPPKIIPILQQIRGILPN
jgi:hypothetical protein